MGVAKCQLNPNHVIAFQNKLKREQKKLKKLKKLKEKGIDVENSNKMDDNRSNDARDGHPAMKEEEELKEEVLRKPTWLQSSYFQKGNFDQKTLHLTWHPTKDVIAAVSGSQLLVFQKL